MIALLLIVVIILLFAQGEKSRKESGIGAAKNAFIWVMVVLIGLGLLTMAAVLEGMV